MDIQLIKQLSRGKNYQALGSTALAAYLIILNAQIQIVNYRWLAVLNFMNGLSQLGSLRRGWGEVCNQRKESP